MKFLRLALAVTLLLTVSAAAQTGLTGAWKIERFSSPYLMDVFDISLNLKTDGKKLTGTANMGQRGDATISDGVVDGDQFSFTATTGNVASNGYSSFPWKMTFEGTIQGDTLKLQTNYGWGNWNNPNGQAKLELEAKRASN